MAIAAGAKINVGPWLSQFDITGVIGCNEAGCEEWTCTLSAGATGLDLWHALQSHMFYTHLDLSDDVTVVSAEFFDEMVASLDDPPVPNEPTREAFRQLNETVTRRPDPEHDAR